MPIKNFHERGDDAITSVILERLNNFIKDFDEWKNEHKLLHENIKNDIDGNGKLGLKKEVLLNTNFRKNFKRFLFIIAAALITQAVATTAVVWEIVRSSLQ